jgi:recombinational DNA repair ATPase RecF
MKTFFAGQIKVCSSSTLKKIVDRLSALQFFRAHPAHLGLRDFRNHARSDADFARGFHLRLGDNAQGKTNILGVYLTATVRSFHSVGGVRTQTRTGRQAGHSKGTERAQVMVISTAAQGRVGTDRIHLRPDSTSCLMLTAAAGRS